MSFDTVSHLILRTPDLYGTLSSGQIIGLYDPDIRYLAANEPLFMLGRRDAYTIVSTRPDTYTLRFVLDKHDASNRLLTSPNVRLTINQIVFTIEESASEGDTIRYVCTGYPKAVAATIPKDETPVFGGWENVGHDYQDESYEYD